MTATQPFQFRSDARGDVKKEQFYIRVDEELKAQEEQKKFRAKPFVPKVPLEITKSKRQLTEIEDVVLSSDRRAVKRQAFDVEMRQKELQHMEERRIIDLENQV